MASTFDVASSRPSSSPLQVRLPEPPTGTHTVPGRLRHRLHLGLRRAARRPAQPLREVEGLDVERAHRPRLGHPGRSRGAVRCPTR